MNNEFLFEIIGNKSVQRLLHLKSVQSSILTFVIPWVAIITVITNMLVFVLCAVIYSKTKKKNHKPAFVFIGVLSFFDMLIGGYVVESEICDFD